jgi:SAM-dependent methyltransferase
MNGLTRLVNASAPWLAPSRNRLGGLRVPPRERIRQVDESDPLPWYYRPLTGPLYRHRLQMALDLLGPGPFERALEVGYGSGILLPTLHARTKELFATDLHRQAGVVQQMLDLEGAGAGLSVGDVCHLGYAGDSFDVVVCISTLEHLHGEQLERAVRELRRVLRPGGTAVVGVPASGWVMDLLFRAIGFAEIGEHHVSAHDDIAAALHRHFRIDGKRHMPDLLPRRVALYTVFRGRAT